MTPPPESGSLTGEDRERSALLATYRRRAGHYDLTANLYYLMGFREWAYRRRAVAALGVPAGGTVVEIGCGTGLNFELLQAAVGPAGRIIGVDLTDAMLVQARRRAQERGWDNVTLVQSDALAYEFPEKIDGILSTFALSLVPDCDQVIRNGAAALAPGGRWVVLDLKLARRCPAWLVPLLLPLVRAFAVTRRVLDRRPWERIEQAMRGTLGGVTVEQLYGGFAFLAAGERRER